MEIQQITGEGIQQKMDFTDDIVGVPQMTEEQEECSTGENLNHLPHNGDPLQNTASADEYLFLDKLFQEDEYFAPCEQEHEGCSTGNNLDQLPLNGDPMQTNPFADVYLTLDKLFREDSSLEKSLCESRQTGVCLPNTASTDEYLTLDKLFREEDYCDPCKQMFVEDSSEYFSIEKLSTVEIFDENQNFEQVQPQKEFQDYLPLKLLFEEEWYASCEPVPRLQETSHEQLSSQSEAEKNSRQETLSDGHVSSVAEDSSSNESEQLSVDQPLTPEVSYQWQFPLMARTRFRLDTMESQASSESCYFSAESSDEDEEEFSLGRETQDDVEVMFSTNENSGKDDASVPSEDLTQEHDISHFSGSPTNQDRSYLTVQEICKHNRKLRSSASESSSYDGDPVIEEIRALVRESESVVPNDSNHGPIQEEDSSETVPTIHRRNTRFERVLCDAIVHQIPLEDLAEILEIGTKIIDPSTSRPNPIHYTVWQRYPAAIGLLVRKGYDVNSMDNFGQSALHLAAKLGYPEIVSILIASGSEINFNKPTQELFPIDTEDEPLRLALKNGHYDCAEILLENGANPNTQYFFGSEINLISPVRPDLLHLLLTHGGRADERDRNGLTALMKACWLRQGMQSLLTLLAHGADLNIRTNERHECRTALHYAVLSGCPDVVSVLLQHGATVQLESEYNRPSPLHLAVRKGRADVINLLLDAGADIDHSTSIMGTPLHMACSENITNRLELLELLLSRGANPNAEVLGLDGSPLLPPLGDYILAEDDPDAAVVQLLLRHGARVIVKSSHADEPLGLLGCLSQLGEHLGVLKEVLEAAERFDLDKIRRTCLLGERERHVCLAVAEEPLPLRHISRIRLRQDSPSKNPEAFSKLQVPEMLRKYLRYDIS